MFDKIEEVKAAFADLCTKAHFNPIPKLTDMWVRDINAAAGFDHLGHDVVAVSGPALKQLSIKELTAVLAHELGHIIAGDTKADYNVDDPQELQRREFAADIMSAKLTGDPLSLISALRKTIKENGDHENSKTHPALAERIARLEAIANV